MASAAPEALSKRAERIVFTPKGLTVQLLDGPPLIFGDGSRRPPSGLGAARVLADPSSAGATYLDLREPGARGGWRARPGDGEDPMGDAEQATPGDRDAGSAGRGDRYAIPSTIG